MKSRPIPIELLDKYLKGTCSNEEKRAVEDWYFDLDGDEAESAPQVPLFDKMKLFEKIKQHVEVIEDGQKPQDARIVPFTSRMRAVVAVAALLILVCGIYFFTRSGSVSETAPIAYRAEFITLANNTSAIVERKLPDGSSVWLKPGSRLTYERKHEGANRDVTFTGEAFFDVAKDVRHPFIIMADEMKIRVVGTSFNVIALPKSRTFKVSVVTGKVQVTANSKSGKEESVYLTSKQQASFHVSSQKIIQTLLSETQLKKQYWKPFTLNFSDDATMGMVSKELEKAFQIKTEFSDPSLANCHLKVDFNNQQLMEIIDYLEKLLDVNCQMLDGNTLRITGEGCPE